MARFIMCFSDFMFYYIKGQKVILGAVDHKNCVK